MAASKTALFVRKQSGGMFSIVDESMTTGDIYWVDSGSSTGGDTVGHGDNPDKPFLTIDYAVGQCTASNGDRIYVMPGHAEVVSAAADLALDVVGITIIGIGDGASTPTVTLNTINSADVDVDAANVTIENLHFIAAEDDIAVCLDVNAIGFTCRKCRFTQSAADKNFLVCVQDAAAAASDGITVEDCYALQFDAAGTHFINFSGTGTGHIVRRNVLLGDWGTMAIGGAGVVTWAYIADNDIVTVASDNVAMINMAATATGIMVRNMGGGGAVQLEGMATGNLAACQNFYSDHDEDLQGVLDPIST